MTEYTSSSQALREYMTSRERTAYWIETNEDAEFYSPSAPPSATDGWSPTSPMSEAESSRSLPPRMVLRYGNGAPDVPIPNSADSNRSSRSRHRRGDSSPLSPASPTSPTSSSSRHRARSGSHASSPLAQSGPYGSAHSHQTPPAPEEIRVLPSHAPSHPQSSSSNPPRSKSLPRSIEHPPIRHDPMPLPAPPLSANPRIRTPYPGATSPTSRGPPPPPVANQPQPLQSPPAPWHSYAQARSPPHLQKQPPAIIYAPSSNSSHPNYLPPLIYHYPPQMGPNGMIYSHSAPVGSAPYPQGAGMQPMAVPPHTLARMQDPQRGGTWNGRSNHDRSRSLAVVPPPLTRSSSSDSLSSSDSGSTYYVLPAAGQKIHVLPPSPQLSIGTATSTTRSPTSPQSFNKKPPFFKRLLSFAGRFSSSSGNGRRLERRHSTSGAERRPNHMQH